MLLTFFGIRIVRKIVSNAGCKGQNGCSIVRKDLKIEKNKAFGSLHDWLARERIDY
jgi:hypothetical protein